MIEPQSAQDGASACCWKPTLGPVDRPIVPRLAVNPFELPFPFAWPLADPECETIAISSRVSGAGSAAGVVPVADGAVGAGGGSSGDAVTAEACGASPVVWSGAGSARGSGFASLVGGMVGGEGAASVAPAASSVAGRPSSGLG